MTPRRINIKESATAAVRMGGYVSLFKQDAERKE